MHTYELLIRSDEGIEGTLKEMCEHYNILSPRYLYDYIKRNVTFNGHTFEIIGTYKYVKFYEIVDSNNNYVDRGTAQELAKRYGYEPNSIRVAAKSKHKRFAHDYFIKDLGIRKVLEYGYRR